MYRWFGKRTVEHGQRDVRNALDTPTNRHLVACFMLCILVFPEHTRADETNKDVLLELIPGDFATVTPSRIIAMSSKFLEGRVFDKDKLARMYLLRGNAFLETESPKKALEDFDCFLKLKPGDKGARERRARALHDLELIDEAITELGMLVREYPDFAPAHDTLAGCDLRKGEFEKAIEHASLALKINGKLSHAYLVRAIANYFQLHFAACVEDATRAIQKNAESGSRVAGECYAIRAKAFGFMERPREALQDAIIFRKLNPSSVRSVFPIWRVYLAVGKFNVASLLTEEMLGIDRKDPLAAEAEIRTLISTGKAHLALDYTKNIDQLEKAAPQRLSLAACVYLGNARYGKALTILEKALATWHGSIDDESLETYATQAYILSACPDERYRDGPKAKKIALTLCRSTDNQVPRLQMLLAIAYAECGEYDQACAISTALLEQVQGNPYLRKRYEERLEVFKNHKAFRLNPSSPDFWRW